MSGATDVFWDALSRDLDDPEFLREYIVESVRIGAIDRIMNDVETAREQLNLSKAELARSINAEPATIRRLLSSKGANPTLGTLSEIAAVLGYTVTLTPMSEEEESAISVPLRTGASNDPGATARRFAAKAS